MSVYEVKASMYVRVEADSEAQAITTVKEAIDHFDNICFDDYSAIEDDEKAPLWYRMMRFAERGWRLPWKRGRS